MEMILSFFIENVYQESFCHCCSGGGIYAFLPYFLGMYDSPMAISELMLCPIKAPTRIGGILWYLFILIGIYLFIPFVSDRIYHSRRVFGAFIMFWLFTTMIPLVRDYYIHENDILGRCHYLHEFDMLVNFSGYIGFLFLGFGIRKYGDLYSDFLILGHKVGKRIYGIILILVLVVASYRHILFEYFLTIGTVFYAFCVFMLIKDFKIDTKSYFYKVLKSLSTMSFGVYLCHMLVLKCITERLFTAFSTEWHIQCLCMVLTFIISYVFVSILSIIPFKKYLVG